MTDSKLLSFLESYITENRLNTINAVLQNRTRFLTVVLENIHHSQNNSAVLRTCECLGIQDIHMIEDNEKFESNKDISLGADKWLSITHYKNHTDNSLECIKTLKKSGYKIVATSPRTNNNLLEEYIINKKTAIFFGAEKLGISQTIFEHADAFIKIPLFGFTESFNISVAAAITLTEDEINELKLDWTKKSIKKPEMLVKHFYENLSPT
jgi:tRNA (guanosine-2'-O-)-methyltransferase